MNRSHPTTRTRRPAAMFLAARADRTPAAKPAGAIPVVVMVTPE
jgi:hypothetical protein